MALSAFGQTRLNNISPRAQKPLSSLNRGLSQTSRSLRPIHPVNLTRLLLLMLTILATSGEAVTLGLGIIHAERDQIHDRADLGESSEESRENRGGEAQGDGALSALDPFFRISPRSVLWQDKPLMLDLCQGSKPCGKLRRHRWTKVDLN